MLRNRQWKKMEVALQSSFDKSKNGWAALRKDARSVNSSRGARDVTSPGLSGLTTPVPEGETSRPTSRKSLGRKDSVKLFADTALLGTHQKKFAQQGKLLQLKAQSRRESFLKEGGLKKIMAAPKIMQAFRNKTLSVRELVISQY